MGKVAVSPKWTPTNLGEQATVPLTLLCLGYESRYGSCLFEEKRRKRYIRRQCPPSLLILLSFNPSHSPRLVVAYPASDLPTPLQPLLSEFKLAFALGFDLGHYMSASARKEVIRPLTVKVTGVVARCCSLVSCSAVQ